MAPIDLLLLFDEMKIKENLIFDKHTWSLIGFIDLGDTDINSLNFEKKEDLAAHALVYSARGAFFKFTVQYRSIFRTQSSIIDMMKMVNDF